MLLPVKNNNFLRGSSDKKFPQESSSEFLCGESFSKLVDVVRTFAAPCGNEQDVD